VITTYSTTWAALTVITLFSKMLKLKKKENSQKNYKEKLLNLWNILFVEMKISKLINYSTDMC
jgi:hypothetical protein